MQYDNEVWNYFDGIVSKSNVCGGEPVFEGTEIMVYEIAELLNHAPEMSALQEQYPGLTFQMVRAASMYAAAYPRRRQ